MKQIFILLSLAALCCLVSASPGPGPSIQHESHEVTFNVESTGAWDSFVPTFDPSSGTLLSVTIEVRLGLAGEYKQENTGALNSRVVGHYSWDSGNGLIPPAGDADGDSEWHVAAGAPSIPHSQWPRVIQFDPLETLITPGAFDGVVDYAGASGKTVAYSRAEAESESRFTDAATLQYFSGPGSLAVVKTETFSHFEVLHLLAGSGSFSSRRVTANTGTIRVTYAYQ